MYNKLKNGYMAEEMFAINCLDKNIPISRPIYNTEPYDFIVEINGKFKSVQVKKSWRDKKGREVVCLKSAYPRSKIKKVVGEQMNVDFLAVMDSSQNWYIIPRGCIEAVKSNICVSPKGKYKGFLGNWRFE